MNSPGKTDGGRYKGVDYFNGGLFAEPVHLELYSDELNQLREAIVHWHWFVAKCSKITERFRYTPESVFDTFPWRQSPSVAQIEAVAAAGREVRRVRDGALKKIKGGLRAVYRTLELPGKNPLKDAHAELDSAALDAYGFSADDDLLAQLLALNLAVAARIEAGEDVTSPGVPPVYPDAASLITDDCIRP
jgi:hypothetical protein